jgi:hypothetical protein
MADREGILVIVIQLKVTRKATQGCIPHVDLARAAVLLGLALVVEGLSKSPRLYLHVQSRSSTVIPSYWRSGLKTLKMPYEPSVYPR